MKAGTWFRGDEARHRWGVASRVLAAAVGGYAVAALTTAALALALPRIAGTARIDAVLAATLSSFAIYAAAVMVVFTTRSAVRAWATLAAFAAVLGALVLVLGRSA
jgi:hypothetical protein